MIGMPQGRRLLVRQCFDERIEGMIGNGQVRAKINVIRRKFIERSSQSLMCSNVTKDLSKNKLRDILFVLKFSK